MSSKASRYANAIADHEKYLSSKDYKLMLKRADCGAAWLRAGVSKQGHFEFNGLIFSAQEALKLRDFLTDVFDDVSK